MINIVFSVDPSTEFLSGIISNLDKSKIANNLLRIEPTDESYSSVFNEIAQMKKNSIILFLGHGHSSQLYGGECPNSFPKKAFVKKGEMNLFNQQFLFLLACNSADLIKSSVVSSKITKAIGFGELPTSMEEIENNRRLSTAGISISTIELFKKEIVDSISKAFTLVNYDFNKLSDYLRLIIDKKINNAILIEKDNNLALLLFRMRQQMLSY